MKLRTLLLCLSIAVALGCASSPKAPEKSQLEMREFQTRDMATTDVAVVLKAVVGALQDESYIIKTADRDLGLLTATREIDVENKTATNLYRISAALSGSAQNATWAKNTVEECSANVSTVGERCTLRVVFQKKLMDNHGNVVKIEQVEDAKHYEDFFAKMDKSLFIQKEGI